MMKKLNLNNNNNRSLNIIFAQIKNKINKTHKNNKI